MVEENRYYVYLLATGDLIVINTKTHKFIDYNLTLRYLEYGKNNTSQSLDRDFLKSVVLKDSIYLGSL